MPTTDTLPRPWVLLFIFGVLTVLALLSFVAQGLGTPVWLLRTGQVVGLVAGGGWAGWSSWRALRETLPQRETLPRRRWRAAFFFDLAALCLAAMTLGLALAVPLQNVADALVEVLSIPVYVLATVGIGFGFLALGNVLLERNEED